VKRSLKHKIRYRLDHLPFILSVVAMVSNQYRISIVIDETAKHLENYDHRKQHFVFCKNVIAAYNEADLYDKIHIIDFANRVNEELCGEIQINEHFREELMGTVNGQ